MGDKMRARVLPRNGDNGSGCGGGENRIAGRPEGQAEIKGHYVFSCFHLSMTK